ncbi:MAG: methyltransferase domain-containing protein [Muricomes sp.]
MKWNSVLYDKSQAFVSEYGNSLISFVPQDKEQCILDIGCGTGDLTQKLREVSGDIIGIDGSKEMIEMAKSKYPQLKFEIMDACCLPWENKFDVIFSNAVFHWISAQEKLLKGIYAALRDGGKLISEFGANGNIYQIESAYRIVVPSYKSPFYFPTVEDYSSLLQKTGFAIEKIYDYSRPTPLPDGKDGLRNWMKQFFASNLSVYEKEQQEGIFENVEKLLEESLFDGTKWVADYRRIRVIASK